MSGESKEDRRQMMLSFREVFTGQHGERVLGWLSQFCHEHGPTYVDGNPNKTAYKEGQRSIILFIRAQMSYDPSKVRQKVKV